MLNVLNSLHIFLYVVSTSEYSTDTMHENFTGTLVLNNLFNLQLWFSNFLFEREGVLILQGCKGERVISN